MVRITMDNYKDILGEDETKYVWGRYITRV